VWLALSTAAAQVPGLRLVWRAPERCPTQADVEQAVLAARLDRGASPGREVSAYVAVDRRSDGTYRAILQTKAPEGVGKRELDGESCEAIASATAVVLTLALEAPIGAELPVPEPTRPARSSKPPPAPRWERYVGMFGGGVFRALPEPAPLFGIMGGLRRGRYAGELSVSSSFPEGMQVDLAGEAYASFSMFSLQASGCLAPITTTKAAVDVCAGVLAEYIAGRSGGISNPAAISIVLLSPVLALRSRVRLAGRLELGLGVAGIARPTQPRFVIGGVGQVYEIPVFDGLFDAGARLSF
jgi:hypothetical protein